MKKNLKAQGFTLIEILVVIGIIAILAAIVLIAINPARQFAQANNSQRNSNVNAILNAIGQYAVDHRGGLPAGIAALATSTATAISSSGANICGDLIPTYMPSLPTDPKSASQGASITNCSSYDTGYRVMRDAQGRITIDAPMTELATSSSAIISVTR